MKENFVHIVFVIDESGSMYNAVDDVIGGFKKVVDEQRENTNGTCAVSYYKFADKVKEVYLLKDINNVEYIDNVYCPGGCTALFDGVGTAIDKVGKRLAEMSEDERPEKNLIVIMTDGGENASTEYKSERVKEMIKEQEDKYNWSFIYMGSDVRDAKDANSLGLSTRLYASKSDYLSNYTAINNIVRNFRDSTDEDYATKDYCLKTTLGEMAEDATIKYANDNNLDAKDLLS